jgi:hypothetical protein
MGTEKPGPFAVAVFVPGCGGNITLRQVTPQGLERLPQPLIYLKHGHSLTHLAGPFTSASENMTVGFIWILLTTVGALLRSDPTDGK